MYTSINSSNAKTIYTKFTNVFTTINFCNAKIIHTKFTNIFTTFINCSNLNLNLIINNYTYQSNLFTNSKLITQLFIFQIKLLTIIYKEELESNYYWNYLSIHIFKIKLQSIVEYNEPQVVTQII